MSILYKVNDNWKTYEPNPKVIYLISHGFNGNIEILQNLGFTVYHIYEQVYDNYPTRWKEGDTTWITNPSGNGKNLASLVDMKILPQIKHLISIGEGPSLVLTGSRGGQVTMSRLWNFWRGPSICLNGGCTFTTPVPNVKLGLITGGNDFFQTKDLNYTMEKFKNWPDDCYVYHNINDDHSVSIYNEAITFLLGSMLNYKFDNKMSDGSIILKL